MMPVHLTRPAVTLVAALALAVAAVPQASAQQAHATLKAADGATVGTVGLSETPSGVLLTVALTNVPAGPHAFHIHAVGTCTPPDFASAGGHYNPAGHAHGLRNPQGRHAGDLPNLHVAADGTLNAEILADRVSLAGSTPRAPLFDADGSAFVIHAGADDYTSDPAGNAGARIACGIVEKAD